MLLVFMIGLSNKLNLICTKKKNKKVLFSFHFFLGRSCLIKHAGRWIILNEKQIKVKILLYKKIYESGLLKLNI